jgi:hypothetical protein
MKFASLLWRRVDRPGHEACRLMTVRGGWRLSGTAVFDHRGLPCRLDYDIRLDAAWNTKSAAVEGWVGAKEVRREIAVSASHRWAMDGKAQPRVAGCVDVDLNFSPSTNVLPIRRLALGIGKEATVRAAWLRFPSFTLEPLEQLYRRTGRRTYRYESAGGRFTRDLDVDANGLVVRYPGLWEIDRAAR